MSSRYTIDTFSPSARRLKDVIFRTLVPFTSITPNILRRRKFHSTFRHWIACIEEYGAPYWYSGEANEEFHKIAAKVVDIV